MTARTKESAQGGNISRSPRQSSLSRDIAARKLAARRLGLLTTSQLLRCGFTRRGIQSRYERGRLFRVHRGVFSLYPPPLSKEQLWLAAVLACGEGAVLSDWAAAAHWRLRPWRGDAVDVISPRRSGRGRKGIIMHERRLERPDWLVVRCIPCATATRTIVDLAPQMDEAQIESLLVQAESFRLLNRARLEALVRARRNRLGSRRIMNVLGLEPAIVRSPAELDFLALCRRVGVPRPLVNEPIAAGGRAFEVDFCWPSIRLIVEVDGYAFHGSRERARKDRDKDQMLALAGWSVHRFPADRIWSEPDRVGKRVLDLIELARTKK